MTSKCTSCLVIKRLSEFNIHRKNPNGHAYICRACKKKKYRGLSINERAELKERDRMWRVNHPERIKEMNRRNFKIWWLKNKDLHDQRRKVAREEKKQIRRST